jgi:flavin reductase (DIM6/NTAB) family NADH-FMN oxidoreductase RutF
VSGHQLNGPKAVLRARNYPIVVATVRRGGARAGCLVGFHTQCSIEPTRYLVCISGTNRTARIARRAPALAVHFLSASDLGLAHVFGEETGDDVDKFAQCAWDPGPFDLPLLRQAGSWLAGPVVERRVVGDHQAVVIDAQYGGGAAPGVQLQYTDVQEFHPGHPA